MSPTRQAIENAISALSDAAEALRAKGKTWQNDRDAREVHNSLVAMMQLSQRMGADELLAKYRDEVATMPSMSFWRDDLRPFTLTGETTDDRNPDIP